jgi:flagellar assembly protein FliH
VRSVAFNFDDMADRANDYLGAVHNQAREIIARAETEANRVRQRAEQEGRQAALRAAEKALGAKLDQQLKTLLPALDETIRSIEQTKQSWLNHWDKTVVGLAAAIASRVIRRELTRAPEITLELVREALELASGGGRLKLRLNPGDYESLGDRAEQLAARIHKLAPADVIADPEIRPGGCRVDTEFGAIDQQIEAQLARIEEELT